MYTNICIEISTDRDMDCPKSFRGPPSWETQIKDLCVHMHFLRDREIDFMKGFPSLDSIKMISKVFSLSKNCVIYFISQYIHVKTY